MSNVKIINCYFCNLPCNITSYEVGECNNCSSDKIKVKVYKTQGFVHIYHYSYYNSPYDRSVIYHVRLDLISNKTEVFIKDTYQTKASVVLEGFPISPTTSLKTIETCILLS